MRKMKNESEINNNENRKSLEIGKGMRKMRNESEKNKNENGNQKERKE